MKWSSHFRVIVKVLIIQGLKLKYSGNKVNDMATDDLAPSLASLSSSQYWCKI